MLHVTAWAIVKCSAWSRTSHRGGSIYEAVRTIRKWDLPIFYYEKDDYQPSSFSESYWVDASAKMAQWAEEGK